MKKSLLQKIVDILMVRRPELEGKWWHRLVNVLIYGSTIFLVLVALFIIFTDSSWQDYQYVIHNIAPVSYESTSTVQSLPVDNSSVNQSTVTATQLQQILQNPPPRITTTPSICLAQNKYTVSGLAWQIRESYDAYYEVDNRTLIVRLLEKYPLCQNVLGSDLSIDIIYSLIIIISWFLFWESIIYRAIIYIVYGKRK